MAAQPLCPLARRKRIEEICGPQTLTLFQFDWSAVHSCRVLHTEHDKHGLDTIGDTES